MLRLTPFSQLHHFATHDFANPIAPGSFLPHSSLRERARDGTDFDH